MIWLNVLLLSNPSFYFGLFLALSTLFTYLQVRKKAKIVKIGCGIGALVLAVHFLIFLITMTPKDPL